MNTEREEHNRQTGDYSNGYRYRKMYGCGAPSAKQRGNECRGYNYLVTTFRFENEKFKWDIA